MDRLKTSPPQADNDLINDIRSGGAKADQAILSLYGAYCKDIRSWISRFVSRYRLSKCEADDLVHDSFIVMLQKIQSGEVYISSVKTFWLGIAKYQSLNKLKKMRQISILKEDDEAYPINVETPETIFEGSEEFRHLEPYFRKCGQKCCEILLLWLRDYSMEEIAAQLGLSGPAMARKIKYNCFKKLKILLSDGHILGF